MQPSLQHSNVDLGPKAQNEGCKSARNAMSLGGASTVCFAVCADMFISITDNFFNHDRRA